MIYGGEGSCEVAFDDVHVPEENIIGDVGMGASTTPWDSHTGGRANIAAMCVGSATTCSRPASSTPRTGCNSTSPSVSNCASLFQLAGHGGRGGGRPPAGVQKMAWLADEGEPLIQAAAYSKLYATRWVRRAADTAIQHHGGIGLTRELGLERIYRFVRILRVVEGTSEIQRYLIGKSLGSNPAPSALACGCGWPPSSRRGPPAAARHSRGRGPGSRRGPRGAQRDAEGLGQHGTVLLVADRLPQSDPVRAGL